MENNEKNKIIDINGIKIELQSIEEDISDGIRIERSKLEDYVKEKINLKKCPLCSNKKWEMSDALFNINTHPNSSGIILTFPAITLTCTKCGYSHLINAINAGLVENNYVSESPIFFDSEE